MLEESIKKVCKKIAPCWPLENMVAVNPFLGYMSSRFTDTAHELNMVDGIQMTMPTSFYLEKISEGEIALHHVNKALSKHEKTISAEDFLKSIRIGKPEEDALHVKSFTDLISQHHDFDWTRFTRSRISSWAGSYFDKGQASWRASFGNRSIYSSWLVEARVDRTLEISGLKSFRKVVQRLPEDPKEATRFFVNQLRSNDSEIIELYCHRLLRIVGGWSSYIAYLDWQEGLEGKEGHHLEEFLVILLAWDYCLTQSLEFDGTDEWIENMREVKSDLASGSCQKQLADRLVLQTAYDLALREHWVSKINKSRKSAEKSQPLAQAVFCIDVRSEVFRRNLESVNSNIETLGFAGFFGFPISRLPVGKSKSEPQCPVLLKPKYTISEHIEDRNLHTLAGQRRVLSRQLNYTWKSFKSGAITCFSYVSPLGLAFLPKLFSDTFGWTRSQTHPDDAGLSSRTKSHLKMDLNVNESESTGIPFEDRVSLAKGALTAMSLKKGLSKYVLLVGHGSSSVNNPQATGLDCGACGGHTGEANAKVAADVLNDPDVRSRLAADGINVPEDTVFIAGLHDTTTDEVKLFSKVDDSGVDAQELKALQQSFDRAGRMTRLERSLRMSPHDRSDASVRFRSKDWSQVRPEWGLAGCSAFVIADRSKTSAIDMEGKSFLHSYDWKEDEGFAVLEQIMTAPMIVTSWINLQYFGSTVDNEKFGAGNKTLHNVTAGLGVIEGATGDLRQGLAYQSVHDGFQNQHDPARLNVVIQAPEHAILEVVSKHQMVRDLCENEWISLLLMDDSGQVIKVYKPGEGWESID